MTLGINRDCFDPKWVLQEMRKRRFSHSEAHRLLEESCHAMCRLLDLHETTIKNVRTAIGDTDE